MTGVRGNKLHFALVGGSAFVLGGLMIEGLAGVGVSPYLAQFPTFLAGASYTWWMNRRHTFDVGYAPTLTEYTRYMASSAGGMALSMAIFTLLVWLGTPALAALAGGSVAGLVFNYWSYATHVFRRTQPPR